MRAFHDGFDANMLLIIIIIIAGLLVLSCASQSKEGVHGKDLVSELSGDFLMKWQFLTSAIVRDLTLHSAPSFGEVIHMLTESRLSCYQKGVLQLPADKCI